MAKVIPSRPRDDIESKLSVWGVTVPEDRCWRIRPVAPLTASCSPEHLGCIALAFAIGQAQTLMWSTGIFLSARTHRAG
jgi:hypothetical protein